MLVQDKRSSHSEQRASGPKNEGEAARQLLEKFDFQPRRTQAQNGQYEFFCPFHEEAGKPAVKDKTNFYLNSTTSQYYCQAASCGESGNYQTLRKFFDVNDDPQLLVTYKSKNADLQKFQARLTADLRQTLYHKGLNDETIDRFRIGWHYVQEPTEHMSDEEAEAAKAKGGYYVIPYLEGRRPVAFRFYDPTLKHGPNGSKYWWEQAKHSIQTDEAVLRLFNPGNAAGDENGRVFICEGEFKAMLLARNGKAAVSIPGVTSFKPEWAQFFMHAKDVVILMDNDNPDHHRHGPCRKCGTTEKADCSGHNPGQDGADKLLDFFGHRARKVVLPLPTGEEPGRENDDLKTYKKTDINEYIMRDGHSFLEFDELIDGPAKVSPFLVRTFAQIREEPPDETVFLVDQGLLPKGGRLLVTGAPKVGKSIFAQNLALSIASGIPFLARGGFAGFKIAWDDPQHRAPGHRVLLLDRELSKRSLYDRLNTLMDGRPGYQAAEDKLLIDHDFALRLDADNAAGQLINLIQANSAEVIILDTAYKFFAGDMENAKSVATAFAALDKAIQETGVSVVLTHHHRKGGSNGARSEAPSPDQVMGSFLWTGWPNGTVLLNFKERSVSNPYDVIASFAAFRDAAAPEPLLLSRTKESICYSEIKSFSYEAFEEESGTTAAYARVHANRLPLTTENVANALLEAQPVIEDEFMHMVSARFGCKPDRIKIHLLDILDTRKDFVRDGNGSRQSPYKWRYAFDKQEEKYDQPELAI
jgi:hypothetical protein